MPYSLVFFFAHICLQENFFKLSIVIGTIAIVIDEKVLLTYCYRKQNYRDTAMSRPIVTPLLGDVPRRQLVVTGDSARIQDETTENSAWFFYVLGV